jgi:hypothetical protein
MPSINDFAGSESVIAMRRGGRLILRLILWRRSRLILRQGQIDAESEKAQSEGRKAQGRAHWMLHE